MTRIREISTIMLIANITHQLGNKLPRTVNAFRRSFRKYLNKLEKNERAIYNKSLQLATKAWDESYNDREKTNDLSVASTLDSLNLLIEDVKWVRAKVYTQKQFIAVYASIINDRDVFISAELEASSKEFTDTMAKALGFKEKNNLKLLLYTLKQNRIIEGKDIEAN